MAKLRLSPEQVSDITDRVIPVLVEWAREHRIVTHGRMLHLNAGVVIQDTGEATLINAFATVSPNELWPELLNADG